MTFYFYNVEDEQLLFSGEFLSWREAEDHGDIVYGKGCYFIEENEL